MSTRHRWTSVAITAIVLLGSCSDGGSSDSADASTTSTTAAATEPAPTACERLRADSVSFAAGEAFAADDDSATSQTCRYPRDAAPSDSINLTLTASELPADVQLDALESSPAIRDFRRLDLGEGGFSAIIDDKPHVGVFVGGELVELVLVATSPLGGGSAPDEMLTTLLREAAGL